MSSFPERRKNKRSEANLCLGRLRGQSYMVGSTYRGRNECNDLDQVLHLPEQRCFPDSVLSLFRIKKVPGILPSRKGMQERERNRNPFVLPRSRAISSSRCRFIDCCSNESRMEKTASNARQKVRYGATVHHSTRLITKSETIRAGRYLCDKETQRLG